MIATDVELEILLQQRRLALLRVAVLHRALERVRPGVARDLVGGRDIDQQRDLLVVRDLRDCDRRAGAPLADQQLHLLLADQALRLIVRGPRLALAVAEHELDLVAAREVLRVHFLGGDRRGDAVGLAGPRGVAGERQQHADLDGALAAGLRRKRRTARQAAAQRRALRDELFILILPVALGFSSPAHASCGRSSGISLPPPTRSWMHRGSR